MKNLLLFSVFGLVLQIQADAAQTPLNNDRAGPSAITKKRGVSKRDISGWEWVLKGYTELKGRFLHITDFHPDPHYVAGATFESGCHRLPKKKKKGKGVDGGDDDLKGKEDDVSGKWGSAVS